MLKLLLVLTVCSINTLIGMEFNTPPVLTWAHPRMQPQSDAQNHPAIKDLNKKVLFSAVGIEQARRYLEGRPASGSNLEGLDLSLSRKPRQQALKLTALLNAKRNDDPRGFVLQETMCTPQALEDWHAMLPQEPSVHREGWHPDQDKQFAQTLLATTRLPAQLKNIYITSQDKHKAFITDIQSFSFSPDYRYIAGTNAKGEGVIVDMTTQKVIHTTTLLYPYEHAKFSADNRFCMLPLAAYEERNGYVVSNQPHKTTIEAFDLTTNTVVPIPQDCTTQQNFPVIAFSEKGRYAVLKTNNHIGILDTRSQEVIIKFPETKHWYSTASISPDAKYCFIPTIDGLKLYDLENEGNELRIFPLPSYNSGKILWTPDSTCCLVPKELSQHTTQYHVYYPADNAYISLDTALHNYTPCFSPDGRYCYVLHENNVGRIYDLKERKAIKTFEHVRTVDCEAPPAFFSQDPEYPYCVVPLLNDKGQGYFTHTDLRIAVFNLHTGELVPEVSSLKGVLIADWPQTGPYYVVRYNNPVPANYRCNVYPSIEIRDKRTHAVVVRADNASFVQWMPHAPYVKIESANEGKILVDMVHEQAMQKCSTDCFPLPNGRILENRNHTLYEVVPADCNWSSITSQQLCLILYAALMYHKNTPLDFTKTSNSPLRVLFRSLDDQMQEYVARACNIKV